MLKGDKVNLRLLKKTDIPTYAALMEDVSVRGEFFPLKVITETTLEQRFAKDGFWSEDGGLMLVVEKVTDRIVGSIFVFKPVVFYDAFELGYIILDTESRGKGYMPEAVKLMVGFLFDLKPYHRIQLQIEPANKASLRVAEKCGFKYEGLIRKAFFSRGKAVDVGMHSVLRDEWEASGRS